MSIYSPGPSKTSTASKITGGTPAAWNGPNGERGAQVPFLRTAVPTLAFGYQTIWPGSGEFNFLSAPATVELITAGADDGKTIEVSYLSTDFAPRPPVTLICDNATPPTIADFYRISRMRVTKDLGTRLTADATLENGGTIYALVSNDQTINQNASFAFPAGFFGAVCSIFLGVPDGKSVSIRLQKRETLVVGAGASWEDLETIEGLTAGTHLVPFCMAASDAWSGIKTDPGTDVRIQAVASGVNQSVSGHFSVLAHPIPAEFL